MSDTQPPHARAELAELCKALAESQGKLAIASANAAELAQQRDEALAEIKSKNKLLPSLLAEGVQMERERAIKAEQQRDSLRAQVAELRGAILGLGKLCHAGEYLESDREFMCDADMQRHNAVVSRLRAEAKEEETKA